MIYIILFKIMKVWTTLAGADFIDCGQSKKIIYRKNLTQLIIIIIYTIKKKYMYLGKGDI